MTTVEERLARLEDLEAIRALDAEYCRTLDAYDWTSLALDGDRAEIRSTLWQRCVQDGVPHVAAGRYTDLAVRDGSRWLCRTKAVSFDYFAPLAQGWDDGLFTLDAARPSR